MPMLYVAWADGDLTPAELKELKSFVNLKVPASQAGALSSWLNPDAPPSQAQLAALLRDIKQAASELDTDKLQSLTELGLKIAELNCDTKDGMTPSPEDLNALMALEKALGFVGHELHADIIPAQQIDMSIPLMDEPEAEFEVKGMTRLLDGKYASIRDRIRAAVQAPGFIRDFELNKQDQREQVLAWCVGLANQGITELAYPGVTCDGVQDLGEFLATTETLAFFDQSLVIKYGVQFGLFGGSIYFLGTKKHHDAYLKQVSTLELPGCFAMTELGHGSNVRDLETTAEYQPETDTLEIHSPTPSSRKMWIGNAALHGKMATVFAQLIVDGENHGVHAILVPIRGDNGDALHGVEIEDCGHKMGLNGVDNGLLSFERVQVPRDNLLNKFGDINSEGVYTSEIASPSRRFFSMLGTLVAGRVSIASAALSSVKVGLTIAIRYAARRRQFGPAGKPEVPILNYRSHQRKLMPRLARTYAIHFALRELVPRYLNHKGEDNRDIEALAAALKAYSTRHNTDTLQVCREACGGQGFLSANLIPMFKNDTDVYATFEGDNTVLLQLVAKSLLTTWRRQFNEDKYLGIFKYLSKRAGVAITERNPFMTRQASPEHLRDPEFHVSVAIARENDLLNSVAQRLKRRIDRGMTPFEAFNDCQVHLLSLAQSYCERVVVKAFNQAVLDCKDPSLRDALEPLRALYGLSVLEENIGWYLENGYFESSKAKAIRKEVNALCGQVRQQAIHLVDAFGIPENCVNVPINR